MFCEKCGNQIEEGASFCTQCGARVTYNREDTNTQMHISDNKSFVQKETVKHKEWFDNSSNVKKIIIVSVAFLVGGVALYALIVFLRKFWYLLFGILVVLGIVTQIISGSEKEKREAKKFVLELGVGIVIILAVSIIIANKPDILINIVQPGASVRNAYLTQYDENVTIEEAFKNFFDKCKWSTYKESGYSYVVFTGSCEYLGNKSDVKVTFKITGDNFIVDSLDVNGREQNDLILYSLLSAVYEDY